jgi:hypothetical protein
MTIRFGLEWQRCANGWRVGVVSRQWRIGGTGARMGVACFGKHPVAILLERDGAWRALDLAGHEISQADLVAMDCHLPDEMIDQMR